MRSQLTTVLLIVGVSIVSMTLIGAMSSGVTQSDASAPEANSTASESVSAPNPEEHSLDFSTNGDSANMYVRFHYGMLSNLPEGGDLGVSVVGVFEDNPIVGTKATVNFDGGSSTSADKLSDRISSVGFVHVDMPILGVEMDEEIHPEMKPSSEGYSQLDRFDKMASQELEDSEDEESNEKPEESSGE